jgi:hypothetical protein
MENAPAIIEAEYKVINIEDFAMTPDKIVKQVRLIQEVMEKVMKKDEHFGIIPGCEKPSLYKPGAEKLSVTFRLVPKYEIKQIDFQGGHREIQVVCTLIHAPTGQFFGQGVGSCTSMEGKYKYRNAEPEVTEKRVPKNYWDLRKQNKMNEAQNLLGGKGFTTKKTEDGWFIAKKSLERVEHDNPADYYNTVLKMAKKRAHVDAVLTATAASDIFTQDIEDMPEVINVEGATTTTGGSGKPEQKKKTDKKKTSDGIQPLNLAQAKQIIKIASSFESNSGAIIELTEEQATEVIDWYCSDPENKHGGRSFESGQALIFGFPAIFDRFLEAREGQEVV